MNLSMLDILLGLLLLLLAGLAYAIESGAAAQHKKAVVSTMFTVFATVLYLMFMVDDKTNMQLDPYVEAQKKKGGKKRSRDGGDSQKEKEESEEDGGGGDGEGSGAGELATGDKALEKYFSDCDVCPSMVRVQVGRFRMGSPKDEPGRQPNEGPMQVIEIPREFAAGRFEITRKEYNSFITESGYQSSTNCVTGPKPTPTADWRNPRIEQSPNHPVVCVTYRDAVAYTKWLSKRTGKSYRLPTESEWEYIARGGSQTAFGVGETLTARQANFGKSRDGTTPIGFAGGNKYGIYEAHGNAAELVADCWAEDLLDIPKEGSPYIAPNDCRLGVVRGGSWQSPAWEARSASRRVLGSDAMPYNTVGFRVVRDMDFGENIPVAAAQPALPDADPSASVPQKTVAAQKPRADRSQDHLE